MKVIIINDNMHRFVIKDKYLVANSLLHTLLHTEVATEKDEEGNYILRDIDSSIIPVLHCLLGR